jgi:hypothetical protein
MAPKKCTKDVELRRKQANDPSSFPSENVERHMTTFSNRTISIERGIKDDLNAFERKSLFDEMDWSMIYNMKKPICPTFIRILFY